VRELIRSYLKLPKPILNLIASEFFLQLINTSFLSIQIIFMQNSGYSDYESAGFIAFRFLGVILLAVPFGYYIKGKKLKPFFYAGALGGPVFALLIIIATKLHSNNLLYTAQLMWGISFVFNQIPVIPYILRNSSKEQQTEGISLSYSTYSFAGILGGLMIFILNKINPQLFNEGNILLIIVLICFVNIYFIFKMPSTEVTEEINSPQLEFKNYDWPLISKALIPTLIIAVGAGLTIPFVGIFFYNVHKLTTDRFGILSAFASVLVAIGALYVPLIKKHIGFKIAIPTTQTIAVIALALLATTQFYAHLTIALAIAAICFLVRQPLMNMAGPMTTELVMDYVGKKNQEMVSALTSAIWSGSWFISGLIFKYLRQSGIDYVYVFLITVILYGLGVVWYYYLILDYHKKSIHANTQN
jgi:MFS family permease